MTARRGAFAGKAQFGHIYNEPDPAAYYRTLGAYDYRIPEYGARVARRLFQARREHGCGQGARPPTVLDVCCSYGIGAALLTTDLDLDDLYTHYGAASRAGQGGAESVQADRAWFAEHRRDDPARVIGLDVAENAVSFAVASGIVAHGIVADLEGAPMPPQAAAAVAEVDLIMCTGGVGYITERTFGRLLSVIPTPPWLAVFCLRTYDFAPIAGVLAEHGLCTERAQPTFPQRRFVDDVEREWAIDEVRARGLDPTGKEDNGVYHADLYVSRPPQDARRRPLAELISDPRATAPGPTDLAP